jgi:hypothetical protein
MTMHEQEYQNRAIINGFDAAATLAAWLKPGVFALRVGQLKAALQPHAVAIEEQRTAALRLAAALDERGEPVTMQGEDGKTYVRYASPDAGAEFTAKERELYNATTVVRVPLLKLSELGKIDTERRDNAGALSVNFDALLVFVEDDTATAAPAAPTGVTPPV